MFHAYTGCGARVSLFVLGARKSFHLVITEFRLKQIEISDMAKEKLEHFFMQLYGRTLMVIS